MAARNARMAKGVIMTSWSPWALRGVAVLPLVLLIAACSSTTAASTTTTATGKEIAATQFRLVLGPASSCKNVKANPSPASPAVLRQVANSPALGPPSECLSLGPAQFEVTRVASAQIAAFPQTQGAWQVSATLTSQAAAALGRMFTVDYHKEFATVVFGQVQDVGTAEVKGVPIDGLQILVGSHTLAERIFQDLP